MDELSLTRAEKGRRLNGIEPEQSLLLRKPTMTAPHRGGLQLKPPITPTRFCGNGLRRAVASMFQRDGDASAWNYCRHQDVC